MNETRQTNHGSCSSGISLTVFLVPLALFLILIVCVAATSRGMHESLGILILILSFCQVDLLLIWVGFGQTWWLPRVLGLVFGLVALHFIAWLSGFDFMYQSMLWASPFQVISWLLTIILSCRHGVCIEHVLLAGTNRAAEATYRKQFTIARLMILIAVIGLLLGIVRVVPPWQNVGSYGDAVVDGICFGFVGILGLWAGLGNEFLPFRLGVLLVVASILGLALQRLFLGETTMWIALTTGQAVCVTGVLLFFRRSGYLLCRRKEKDRKRGP